MRLKKILPLILSSFLATILLIGVIEIYVLFKNKSNWATKGGKHDSDLGWILKPNNFFKTNGRVSTTNSMGFRSPEIDSQKKHIIVVGDSVSFGAGLGDKETLSYHLGKQLKGFQVLNFSVPGYGVGQYYLNLKKHINKTNPALVLVVIFTGNDMQETRKDNLFGIGKPWINIEDNSIKIIKKSVPRYSCTNLLSRSWTIRALRLENWARDICDNNEYDGINAMAQMEKILLEINKLVLSKNASLLFILSPTIYDYYQEGLNCSGKENLEGCLSTRKNMQELLLAQVKNTRMSHSKDSFKIVDGIKVFRNLSLLFKDIFGKLELPHLDLLALNMNLKRDIRFDYNGANPFHFSSSGTLHLAKSIQKLIKVNDGQISIKKTRRDNIISNQ